MITMRRLRISGSMAGQGTFLGHSLLINLFSLNCRHCFWPCRFIWDHCFQLLFYHLHPQSANLAPWTVASDKLDIFTYSFQLLTFCVGWFQLLGIYCFVTSVLLIHWYQYGKSPRRAHVTLLSCARQRSLRLLTGMTLLSIRTQPGMLMINPVLVWRKPVERIWHA